ncbi:MAG: hypothetical protein H0T42_12110 [Deltaproteobacteria bacterium]|nr:hypothetical protein [Deltaproteobacteria bacterium]
MRRVACGLVIVASTGFANAGPWTVTVEGGGEADTNVQRVETGPGLTTNRVAAGVVRLGAKVDHRAKAFGGSYAFVIGALSRLVTDPEASTENVTLFTGELRYLRPLEQRRVSFGVGLIAADAQPITDDVGARTFRNLGADGLLVFDGSDDGKARNLTFGFGVRDFAYKQNHDFDWRGPIAIARLDLTLWQPSGGTRSVELATYVMFESRSYAGSALANACPPGAPPSDNCSAGTVFQRRDRVQRVGVELTWTGSFVAAAGYQLTAIDSNSYGQSLLRHKGTASVTRSLPLGLYGTALATLQIDQYPDGLVIKTDLQRSEFTSLDDENRSSVQIRIGREVSSAWSIEGRAAIWRNLGSEMETSFRRASLYAGAVYSR